jgi:hypothetical protein
LQISDKAKLTFGRPYILNIFWNFVFRFALFLFLF